MAKGGMQLKTVKGAKGVKRSLKIGTDKKRITKLGTAKIKKFVLRSKTSRGQFDPRFLTNTQSNC